LHAIEIAVDVELEMDRGMIPRPADVQRFDRLKAQFLQIKPVDERIDDANRIVLESCPRSAFSMNPAIPAPADSLKIATSRWNAVFSHWTHLARADVGWSLTKAKGPHPSSAILLGTELVLTVCRAVSPRLKAESGMRRTRLRFRLLGDFLETQLMPSLLLAHVVRH
jgi:hypothetical protein